MKDYLFYRISILKRKDRKFLVSIELQSNNYLALIARYFLNLLFLCDLKSLISNNNCGDDDDDDDDPNFRSLN